MVSSFWNPFPTLRLVCCFLSAGALLLTTVHGGSNDEELGMNNVLPKSTLLSRMPSPSGASVSPEFGMTGIGCYSSSSFPRNNKIPLPRVFACIEIQDRQCLNQLDRQIAYFPTIYTRNEMLTILMAVHQHNPKDSLIQAFHFYATCGPRIDRLWVNFYFFHTYLSLHAFMKDFISFDALRRACADLALRPSTPLEELKRQGIMIMNQAKHFNKISNYSMADIVDEEAGGIDVLSAYDANVIRESSAQVQRNIAKLSAFEDRIRQAADYEHVLDVLEDYFIRGQGELARMNDGARGYIDRVYRFIAAGSEDVSRISPTCVELIFMTLNKRRRLSLWSELINMRRFDILQRLVTEHGMFNLARSQTDRLPYLQTLIAALSANPAASISVSLNPSFWPNEDNAVVAFVIDASCELALYPEFLEDIALNWQDVPTLKHILQHYQKALPMQNVGHLIEEGKRRNVKKEILYVLISAHTSLRINPDAELSKSKWANVNGRWVIDNSKYS